MHGEPQSDAAHVVVLLVIAAVLFIAAYYGGEFVRWAWVAVTGA